MTFTEQFREEVYEVVKRIDAHAVDQLVALLARTRAARGAVHLRRGAGAATTSHAVSDFRKITGIEAYTPPTTYRI